MTSMVWKLFWNRCKYKLLSELLFSVNNFLFSSFIILSKVLNKTKEVEYRLNYKLRYDVLHSVSCNKKTLLLLRYFLLGIELIVLLDHAFAVIYAAHLTTN